MHFSNIFGAGKNNLSKPNIKCPQGIGRGGVGGQYVEGFI